MKSKDALRLLAEVTAYQWGMVTSAQAGLLGVGRLDISRLTRAGHLKRLAQGVYMVTRAPGDQFDDLRVAWLSTDPTMTGAERIKDRANGVVVAGASAARLHGIGDLWAGRHEFVHPKRRQSQRPEIRYRQRVLDPRDVTLIEGLPAMTMERTIADLVEDLGDLSLVADALRDAWRKRVVDLARLRDLLCPLAERQGFTKGDGTALLNRLQEIAGIDLDTVAHRVAANASLGSRVAADYIGNLGKADIDRFVMRPEMQEAMRSIRESISATLQTGLFEQVADVGANMESMRANLIKSADLHRLMWKISELMTSADTILELSKALGKALSDSIASDPESLAVIREAERALADA